MKGIKIYLLFILLISLSNSYAQNSNTTILTIGNEKITQAEFERIYNKNKNIESSGVENPIKNVSDYMELFINFKLKVLEAEKLGLDTTKQFINELAGYKKQLEAPYLTDETVIDQLTKEAYDRMKTEISVSHIMIKLGNNPSPKDTLAAYKKAMEVYAKLKDKQDFALLAKKYSEDPSVKKNDGYLGYFTAFRMVYPFENAAYSTPVGEFSKPVRTRFGYHIIKVNDRREARGRIKVAHIMIFTPKDMSEEDLSKAKAKIDSLYNLVLNGSDFSEIAKKYSEDKGTALKGGELKEFGTGEMVPEFEAAAFKLTSDGQISKPVKSAYGWHIIKRLSLTKLGSFDDEKKAIEEKVRRTGRTSKSKDVFIAHLKKEYSFKQKQPIAYFYNVVDSTIFDKNWDLKKASPLKKVLFTFAKKKISQQDFAQYLFDNQKKGAAIPIENYVDQQYKSFVQAKLISFEETQLESKYPDFKYLSKEYHDGILLFDITNMKVWEKAIKDTLGLEKFYQKNKENYQWEKRTQANIYSCKSKDIAEQTKALVESKKDTNNTNDQILKTVNKDNKDLLRIQEGKFEKGNNQLIDKLAKTIGVSPIIEEKGRFVFVEVLNFLEPEVKKLEEAKGLITSDYQDFLEKEWIKKLRVKYPYKINETVLESIQ